jgi:hypothetical protein
MSAVGWRGSPRGLNREQPDLVVFLGDYAGGHESRDVRASRTGR